jgi:hypothetical protein
MMYRIANQLETSLHLFQPPRYRSHELSWHGSFEQAVQCSPDDLTVDPAAVLSVLSFGYVCGDRTLLKQIRRQPWLSRISENGDPVLESVPPHDTFWETSSNVASELGVLLREEIVGACKGRREVYILLSGGLDSRIVASTAVKAQRDGEIDARLIAVTWGVPQSRDVRYGRLTAERLGIEWIHVPLSQEDLLQNINMAAVDLGCLVSPLHLHRMSWFNEVSRDALVLAASYGDSVGRAEFSKKSVLELGGLRPVNKFDLLKPIACLSATGELELDLTDLDTRSNDARKYVRREHAMQGHYMRGMIGQAMSLINNYCTLYLPFTSPKVYSYMWSIHPARRTDDVYAHLLEQLCPSIARLPWSRTNRALAGSTEGAEPELAIHFHKYGPWMQELASGVLKDEFDPSWYQSTGLFRRDAIEKVRDLVTKSPKNARAQEIYLWLIALRRFVNHLNDNGKTVRFDLEDSSSDFQTTTAEVPAERASGLRMWARRKQLLYNSVRSVRRRLLRLDARRRYPPRYHSE